MEIKLGLVGVELATAVVLKVRSGDLEGVPGGPQQGVDIERFENHCTTVLLI